MRGQLGPLTVWTHPEGHGRGKVYDSDEWTKVYERNHDPSFENMVELKFAEPIRQGLTIVHYTSPFIIST